MRIRIIPDVHGFDWWKEVTTDIDTCDYVIFLGDYIDEWKLGDEIIINNLLDIIAFARSYPGKVVLLYGNHCLQYAFKDLFGFCSGFRASYAYTLHEIYNENKDLFKFIFYIDTIKDSRLVFSHAGISLGWVRTNYMSINPEHCTYLWEETNVDMDKFKDFQCSHIYEYINNAQDSAKILSIINSVSYFRGGWCNFGGPLWADMQETYTDWLKNDGEKNLIQIVGHTPQKHQLCKHYYSKDRLSSIHFCDLGSKIADITLDVSLDTAHFNHGKNSCIII